MRRKDVNMLEGSIMKGILTIAIPVMVMNVATSLFNIIDMTVLKTFGGAVGAVGVCGTLISLITGLVIGVSSGSNVIIARYIGRKDPASVDRAINTAMAFSIAAGIALAIIGVVGAPLFLTWNNCPKELLTDATLYFRLYFAGVPILMVYNFCASILRSSGDSRRPMIFLIIGGIVKVLSNLVFAGVFHLGVMGVAFATILSWCVFTTLGLTALTHNEGAVKLRLKDIRFYKKEMNQILHIGIPAGMQQALYSVANVIITAEVNKLGPAATTGMSIANNFDGILYQISVATSLAIMPYVSQNIGAGNLKRSVRSIWEGILVTVALGGFFGSLSAIFSRQLSGIMSADPEAIKYSMQKMVLISSTYFICGINEILGAALRSMGKPLASTVSVMVWMCGFRFVWVYLIYPLFPASLTYLYLVWPIGWVMSGLSLLCVLIPTVKKMKAKKSAQLLS
ncbi:MAG: MATE family efflux transporter [Oscillospiraceae bacterium]|nr:MATE family efflux transporter [Oscillospiraceae bacterium]